MTLDMEVRFLADIPEAVPLISKWYFDEWGHEEAGNSVERIAERVRGMLNRDKIPLHVVAVEGGEVLGVSQLKIREMSIYPEKEFWLGGVFVAPTARGRGLATRLVGECLDLAKRFRVETLYLQTEQLGGGLYAKLGWKPIEQVRYNGLDVLVMERPI